MIMFNIIKSIYIYKFKSLKQVKDILGQADRISETNIKCCFYAVNFTPSYSCTYAHVTSTDQLQYH